MVRTRDKVCSGSAKNFTLTTELSLRPNQTSTVHGSMHSLPCYKAPYYTPMGKSKKSTGELQSLRQILFGQRQNLFLHQLSVPKLYSKPKPAARKTELMPRPDHYALHVGPSTHHAWACWGFRSYEWKSASRAKAAALETNWCCRNKATFSLALWCMLTFSQEW